MAHGIDKAYLPLDTRKCLGNSQYSWVGTEDKSIFSIQLQREAVRSFNTKLNVLDKSESCELNSDLFGSEFKSPKVYLSKVFNAVVSPCPAGFPRYWAIFGESHYIWQAASDSAKAAMQAQGLLTILDDGAIIPHKRDVEFIDRDCVWLFAFSNYNHTIQETLPTILAIKDLGLNVNDYCYLVGKQEAYDDLLQSIGIHKSNILHNDNSWISCRSLIYPCFQSFGHLYTPTIYLDRLSDFLYDIYPVSGSAPENIYVSRKHAAVRKIDNEAELIKALSWLRFEAIDPGEYSKVDQIIMFSNAKCVVGPHGMGMNNIFFSQRLRYVVEMFTTSWLRPAYWRMSQCRGIDYSAYILNPINEKQNVVVDVDLVSDYVKSKLSMGKK